MVTNIVEPEWEYNLTAKSYSDQCPIVMDTISHSIIYPALWKVETYSAHGVVFYTHYIKFYTPINCTLVDYFVYDVSLLQMAVEGVPHEAMADAYLNKN